MNQKVILVVEDEPRVLASIKQGLEEEGYRVLTATNAVDAMNESHELTPDMAILDIGLPGGVNGLQLIGLLRQKFPSLPILMLTALGTNYDVVRGLDAGADDYMVKPFNFAELMARTRSLLRRGSLSPITEEIRIADVVIHTAPRKVFRADKEIFLTTKEYDLLLFLVRNRDRVVTRREIAEVVWQLKFDTGTNVIDVYVNYLRNKLDKGYEVKLIHTVVGVGYILSEDPRK
jgi:DNA-binding response OmpR family regulator